MNAWSEQRAIQSPHRERYMRLALVLRCKQLIDADRQVAGEAAAHWLKTYCRHWATVGHDTQTMDNLNDAERVIARQHLGTLRRLGKLREGGFRGNFEILE